jgi:hypothetical protein
VEQELATSPEHLSSLPVFSVVRVTRSLVFCVVFCNVDHYFSFCSFLDIVLSVLLYGLRLIHWYLNNFF